MNFDVDRHKSASSDGSMSRAFIWANVARLQKSADKERS